MRYSPLGGSSERMSVFARAALVFAITFLIAPAAHAATITRTTNNLGLVGYWSFDEGTSTKATDFSGRGNTGTLTSMANPSTASSGWTNSGKLGGALAFDGSNDFVNVSGLTQTLSTTTFSAWVKRTGDTAWAGIVFFRGTTASGMDLNNANNTLGYHWNDVANTFGWNSGLFVPLDEWVFVVIVVEPTKATAYLGSGGVLSSAVNSVSHASSILDGLRIGADNVVGRNFPGLIDEARIYDRALTAAQVASLYQSGATRFGNSTTLAQGSTLKSGLVGHWTFDGSQTNWATGKTNDSSGQGNHGTLTNMSTTTTPAPGKISQALNFDGTDDSVVVTADGTALDFDGGTAVSISAWVYIDSYEATVPNIRNIAGRDTGFPAQYLLRLGDSGTQNRIQWVVGTAPTNENKLFATGTVGLNQWYHVVGTWDGTTQTIYINGVGNSQALSGVFTTTATAFRIGTLNSANRFFDGKIDDVHVYNRALSDAEVKQLYNLGGDKRNASSVTLTNGSSLTSGLVGHWTFDGPDTVSTIADKSGQGNNGYFINGATSSAKTIGKMGQGLSFLSAAGDSNIKLAFDPIGASPASICAWVNLKITTGSIHYIFTNTKMFFVKNVNAAFQFSSDGVISVVSASNTIPLNKWTFGCATRDANGIANFYVNGTLSGTPNQSSGTPAAGSNSIVGIGNNSNSNAQPFDGYLDDVRIYSRVLSAAEIKQLYNIGK
jgi:Concanavalin A-like lectin/glucanases superfamily